MLNAKGFLMGSITSKQTLKGQLNNAILNVYPELEDLEIIPSGFEQKFNHPNSYGYNIIKVSPVASNVINIVPSLEKQQHQGLFNTVNVEAMKVPQEQWYTKECEIWT